MKYFSRRNYPSKLKDEARFIKMAKEDMLMRFADDNPDIKRGYLKFTYGIDTDGRKFIDMDITILEKEQEKC